MELLFFAAVAKGKANALLKIAQECGASGGTIFSGEEIMQFSLLDKLGITETQREIIMISATHGLCDKLFKAFSTSPLFSKGKGTAFSIPFKRHFSKDSPRYVAEKSSSIIRPSHFCIVTIVDKGRSKDCISAGKAAGSKKAILIHGRGAGIPVEFYYPLEIEPQKDIVMIITGKDKVSQIRDKIISDLQLKITGNGFLFILPILNTIGLFEKRYEVHKEITT